MNPKIKKINTEYEKNAAKITELQARQEELSKQRTELENLDIIGLVRSMGLDPDQLAALIHNAQPGAPVLPTCPPKTRRALFPAHMPVYSQCVRSRFPL